MLLVCQVGLKRPIWYLRLSAARITLSCRPQCSSGASIAALNIKGSCSWYSYFQTLASPHHTCYSHQPLCCSGVAGLGLGPLVHYHWRFCYCHNEIVVMCKMVKWLLVKPTNWEQFHIHLKTWENWLGLFVTNIARSNVFMATMECIESTKPGNFLNLHFTSNLTQIAYLTNYWRPGTKR